MAHTHHPNGGPDRPLNVLFIGGYDSTNYAYVEVINELAARGHSYTLVVENDRDVINNKMFLHAGIPMTPLASYSLAHLADVDLVVCGPFIRKRVRPLFDAIYAADKYVVSFATLFSSVTMWSAPDLLLASSERKYFEFGRRGLHYNMVAVGNPQYDPLVRLAGERPQVPLDQIRRVLFIDQGAYPLGEEGKHQLARTLVAMATNNPQITFDIKPRYLPDEEGDHLHSVSDHLYSYLQDVPDNLILMRTPTVLEDIVPSYDAMITMWSTAHLDAAALDMPLLLIGGLDSVDVFDVRRQRVANAFEHLQDSGCVVGWRDLLEGPVPFARVSRDYANQELYDRATPCSPRIVDLFERISVQVLRRDRIFSERFQMTWDDLVDDIESLPTASVADHATRLARRWYRELNSIAQTLAFEHRALGYVLDAEILHDLWDLKFASNATDADVDRAVESAQRRVADMKAAYFAGHPEAVDTDPFIQDAYFAWLLNEGRYRELVRYERRVVAPASLMFNKGRAYGTHGRIFRAIACALAAFDISLREPVRVLKLDKNIRVLFSRADLSIRVVGILFLMYRARKYEALAALEVPIKRNVESLVYYKMKALVALGEAAEALALHEEYRELVVNRQAAPLGRRLAERLLRPVHAWYRMRLARYAERLARRSNT